MMNWIDLSGMKAPANLPETWRFQSRTKHMNDEDTSRCDGPLFLTMCSEEIDRHKIFAVKDHVNLSGKNPLRGHNNDELGVRFPDMSHPYALPPGYRGETLIIRAGQHDDYPLEAIDAGEIVYQTILAKHQMKQVYAVIYGTGVSPDELIKLFQGEDYA